MKADFLIRNGHVIDTAAGIDGIKDVAIAGTRIVDETNVDGAVQVIDASGCYVFPGLIDYHTHLYYRGSGIAVNPDFMVAQGTTSAVDAGTAGFSNYEAFYRSVVTNSAVRIKGFVTVFGGGQIDMGINEDFGPYKFAERRIRALLDRFPENILGLKIRISRGVVADGDAGLEPLIRTVELAEKLGNGLRVCVHTTNCPVSAERLAAVLRSGDIFCHCYQGAGNGIVDENGNVYPGIIEARKRGVIFDAANGKGNFGIKTAQQAIDKGFLPDIISTDLTVDKFNMPPYCKNLPTLLSKYLGLGLTLSQVIRCVTETPAKLMNLAGQIGTLAPGAFADVAIFKKRDVAVTHKDFCEAEFRTHELLVPQLTIIAGDVQYCQTDFWL